jgi:hypothetical protein
MFAEVQPVRAAPPTTGLVASAVQPRDDVRWESGFSWLPERCITHQGFSPCGTLDGEPDESPASVAHYLPPGFRVRDICTTLDGARNADRVRRQAEAVTSFIVARELWTGTLTQADPGTVDGSPYVNPFLADGNATEVAAPTDLTLAIATLEQEARVAANGQQVFIHLPMGMLPPVANVRRVGNVLYTANDSVLVADAGYDGTGPDPGTWLYATGPVQVRLSPVEIIDDAVQTVDRTTNRQEIWAERVFAATFDPCVHLAMNVAAP